MYVGTKRILKLTVFQFTTYSHVSYQQNPLLLFIITPYGSQT